MSKYINANALKERFNAGQAYFTDAIVGKIDTAPAVDLVKAVRCENCRFWEPENAEEWDSYGRCRNNYAPCQNQQTDMNWFCADGEMEA